MTATALTRGEAAAELRDAIVSHTVTCGVVGLGFVGSLIAEALTGAGFRVVGHDIAEEAVARFGNTCASRRPGRPGGQRRRRLCDQDEPRDGPARRPGRAAVRPAATTSAARRREHRRGGYDASFRAPLGSDETTFVVHAPERVQGGHEVERPAVDTSSRRRSSTPSRSTSAFACSRRTVTTPGPCPLSRSLSWPNCSRMRFAA